MSILRVLGQVDFTRGPGFEIGGCIGGLDNFFECSNPDSPPDSRGGHGFDGVRENLSQIIAWTKLYDDTPSWKDGFKVASVQANLILCYGG